MRCQFFILVLVCLFFFVTLCHRRAYMNGMRKDPELLQMSLDKLTVELLSERQPILLEDSLVDAPKALLESVFRKLYIRMDEIPGDLMQLGYRCRARYTLVTCRTETGSEAESEAENALLTLRREGVSGVEVRMVVGQVLILPPGWTVETQSRGCHVVSLHDIFTFFWQ